MKIPNNNIIVIIASIICMRIIYILGQNISSTQFINPAQCGIHNKS